MRMLFGTALVVSAMALAAPAFAQAATSYDGTYAGVSLTTSGSGHSCAASSPVPGPLMISGGNAHTQQGQSEFDGTVNAQGTLTMRTHLGTLLFGKVDASGNASAGLTIGQNTCTYSFTWKKK